MALFEIHESDTSTSARTGTLHLTHGPVNTPAFMPVGTGATVKASRHTLIEELGYRLILSNTYHLVIRPGLDVIEACGGLHRFSTWPGNILTDSGGYQVFSLARLRKIHEEGVTFRSHVDGQRHVFTPESVVDAQCVFGSDIQMALDVCTGYGTEREEAANASRTTTAWAKRALQRWKQRRDDGYAGLLFGITQGNFYHDLRETSAREIGALGFPGIAIGGLSVGESASLFREMLDHTAPLLPPDVPHYLMGIGTPDYIFDAVSAGMDMFDCVFPTRIARNGTVLTWDGRLVLRNERHSRDTTPIDPDCGCSVCARYSRAYLRHLFKSGEMLGPILATEHNLFFLADLLRQIRSSIDGGTYSRFRAKVLGRYDEGERQRQSADTEISE